MFHRNKEFSRLSTSFDVRDIHSKFTNSEKKLARAFGQVKELELQTRELVLSNNSIQTRYDKLMHASMRVMWEYCPRTSSDFGHIPPCDPTLQGK